MPELPEVETVMRGLEPFLLDKQIKSVDQRRKNLRVPFPDKLKQRLEGRTVKALNRRAKYIFVMLDDDNVLIVHLGMSGRVSIVPANDKYNIEKHDHLILEMEDGVRIIYNDPRRFGMVLLLGADEIETHPSFKSLGPEPLGNEFSGSILAQRLKGKKVSIKQALLDQRVVAGVGNIYACEALYQAQINPVKEAGRVTRPKVEALAVAVRDVLNRAIKAGGSTLKDYRHADGELGYFQHNFTVYNREKQPCLNCDCDIDRSGGVQRIVQSGRSTFYCAKKQK